jgi:hypothetical protein
MPAGKIAVLEQLMCTTGKNGIVLANPYRTLIPEASKEDESLDSWKADI